MTHKLILTGLVALYLVLVLAGLLCLAAVLPGAWALLVLPLMALNGFMVADWIGMIFRLDGQYDDGTV
jgi:hypothetical protein